MTTIQHPHARRLLAIAAALIFCLWSIALMTLLRAQETSAVLATDSPGALAALTGCVDCTVQNTADLKQALNKALAVAAAISAWELLWALGTMVGTLVALATTNGPARWLALVLRAFAVGGVLSSPAVLMASWLNSAPTTANTTSAALNLVEMPLLVAHLFLGVAGVLLWMGTRRPRAA